MTGKRGAMTVHAERDERIRLLREALDAIVGYADEYSTIQTVLASGALAADDALAATPPPDLPLAEGSEWKGGSLTTRLGHLVTLEERYLYCEDYAATSAPHIADVLVLARRKGLV